MTPTRPSGEGSNSRRFAVVREEGKPVKIPVVKDAGTFIYLSTDSSWPKAPITTLLVDASWIQEGETFWLKELRPGKGMGSKVRVAVIGVDMTISVYPGKFGQIERHVLVNAVPDMDDLSRLLVGDAL